MVGIPGAGKTFFANQFSKTFGAPFLNINRLRYQIFDNPTFSRDENDKLEQISVSLLTEMMRSKKAIILEGKLDARIDRYEMANLAKINGYKVLTVWVQNVLETARTRATKKSSFSNNEIMPVDAFEALVKKFTAPNMRENLVVISGKHTFSTQAKIVLRKIAETHTRAVTGPDVIKNISRKPHLIR